MRGLSGTLDFATGTHARALVLLVAFCLLAFLPGFFQIPPVDRDEARFAQATKQMVESGDYIDIRFQDEVRYKKPVGIYWLQAAVVKTAEAVGVPAARTTIWLYRIPSLIGASGAVLLTYWAALAFVTRRAALLAALMMASSILLGVEARLAKTDAMLLLTSVAAMGAMARIYLTTRRAPDVVLSWRMPAILWTAIAGGVLLKGPLILMIIVLTAVTLSIVDRSWRWIGNMRPLTGLAWMILLVLPWFIAIVLKSGDDFFVKAVGDDMLSKITSGQEAHGAPPGYYLLLFWVTFWPGCVLAGLAAPMVWKARREPGAQFLLAWLVPSWIVFEIVMTKLPHSCAAALSGHCHFDRRHSRARQSVENALDGARNRRLVRVSGRHRCCNGRGFHRDRSRSRHCRLALRRGCFGVRSIRVAALRGRRRRTCTAARHDCFRFHCDHRLRDNVPAIAGVVPEQADRRRNPCQWLHAAAGSFDFRLSGAEPGVHDGHQHALYRWRAVLLNFSTKVHAISH